MIDINQILKITSQFQGSVDIWSLKNLLFGFIFLKAKGLIDLVALSKVDEEAILRKTKKIIKDASLKTYIDLERFMNPREIFVGHSPKEIKTNLKKVIVDLSSLEVPEGEEFFSDIYEALLTSCSVKERSLGGQYYTPKCLGKLIYKFACGAGNDKIPDNSSIYDPTCGSGCLLLHFKNNKGVVLTGQEISYHSHILSLMNMSIANARHQISRGDTLLNDKFENWKFDYIASNPPYGLRWDSSKADAAKFKYGLPPDKSADWAFIQLALEKLTPNGVCLMLVYPGCLTRAKSEEGIRNAFIENDYIKGVVQLPGQLFFGTTINPALLIMSKNKNYGVPGKVVFIDASEEFTKNKKQNVMEDKHIDKVVEAFFKFENLRGFCSIVSKEEIFEKGGVLNVGTFVLQPKEDEFMKLPPEERERILAKQRVNSYYEIFEAIKRMQSIDERLLELGVEMGVEEKDMYQRVKSALKTFSDWNAMIFYYR